MDYDTLKEEIDEKVREALDSYIGRPNNEVNTSEMKDKITSILREYDTRYKITTSGGINEMSISLQVDAGFSYTAKVVQEDVANDIARYILAGEGDL